MTGHYVSQVAKSGEDEPRSDVSCCSHANDQTHRQELVLAISQFYGTDSAAVGKFLADAAAAVVAAGHKFRVICTKDTYRGLNDRDVEDAQSVTDKARNGRGIEVVRLPHMSFAHTPARRILSYATYYMGAVWKAISGPRPDVVLTLTAPPGLAWIGWMLQRLRGSRHVIWEMDLYPDIAVALGITGASDLKGILDYPRRRADAVIALGECMKERLLTHGVPEKQIHVIENWADGQKIYPRPFPESSPLRLQYSGNLGLAHDLGTIQGAIERLANDPTIVFEFVGGGPQRAQLEELCRAQQIRNITFRAYAQDENLCASLGEAHIGLITQNAATVGAVVPSKTYGVMAAGRPILYIGPTRATPARTIERFDCGWCVPCGDVDGLVGLLQYLVQHSEEVAEKGRRGREAFVMYHDVESGVQKVCNALGLKRCASRNDACEPEPTELSESCEAQ